MAKSVSPLCKPVRATELVRVAATLRDDGSSNVPGEPNATPKGPIEGDPSDQTHGREDQA